jgi:moderate conductance mechanosensitive channel
VDQQTIRSILDGLADLGVRALAVVLAALIVFVAYRIARGVVQRVVGRATLPMTIDLALDDEERRVRLAERRRRLETLAAFGLRLVRWFAYVLVTSLAVALLAPGAWTAIGGLGVGFSVAIGGAIGFGAQQLVRDYLNGALILGENPYSVGDVVAIAGVRGVVEDVGLRRTVIRDMEGTVHSVPNGQITVASNFTRTFARVNERIVVAYGTDIERATVLIDEVGRGLAADEAWAARILEAPAVLRVEAVADPGIPILVQGTVRPGEQWAVAGELRRRILVAFAGAGVDLATAHRLIVDSRREAGPSAGNDPGAEVEAGADFT